MFKRIILTIAFLFVFSNSYAELIDTFLEYEKNSTLTNINLNGNLDNIRTVVNSGLDNNNADTTRGFRFYEVLGQTPPVGQQGRIVYNSTTNSLHFDTGSEFRDAVIYVQTSEAQGDILFFDGSKYVNSNQTAAQGDVLYYNGTGWVDLPAGTDGQFLMTQGIAAPAWNYLGEGTPAQGDILYFDGSDWVRLAKGASDQVLGMNSGATAPQWGGVNSQYFLGDMTSFLEYNMGEISFSPIGGQLTASLTSLNDKDDVTVGKINSGACYDYDGTSDYVTIAEDVTQAGRVTMTMEAWVFRDTAGNSDYIIANVADSYIILYMTDTNIVGQFITSSGTEAWDVAHGLSSNGTNQWTYIVVAWDQDGPAEIYINGVDVGDGNDSGNGSLSDSANAINIGADASNGSFFHGKIDGVILRSRKILAAEVLSRYNAFK